MPEVGDLAVVLDARTKEFQGALKEAEKRVSTFEKKTEASTGRVSSLFGKMGSGVRNQLAAVGGAFAAYMGVRGVVGAMRSNLAFLDSLDKVSSKLGVSTDFLQKAQYAADQSGIGFNTLSMAMQRFTRRAGEAAAGTGEAKDAIRELKIDLRDADGQMRSTEVLFSDAMAALAKIDDPAKKLRLAFKLFDSEGAVLVNLADNFEKLSRKADEMGLVVDRSVIRRAVEAKDELATLGQVTKVNLAASLTDLVPILEEVSKAFVTISNVAAAAWRGFADFFNLEPKNLEQMRDRAGELRDEIAELEQSLAKQESARAGGYGEGLAFKLLKRDIKGTRERIALAKVDLEYLDARIAAYEKLEKAGEGARGAADDLGELDQAARQRLMKAAEAYVEASPASETYRAAIEQSFRDAIKIRFEPEGELLTPEGMMREFMLKGPEPAGPKLFEPRFPPEEPTEAQIRFEWMTERLGYEVHETVKDGLVEGLMDGQADAKAIMADVADTMSTTLLDYGVGEMMTGLEDGFKDLFKEVGPKLGEALGMADMGPLSGAVTGALATAAGIGLSMVMQAIGGTKKRQTYADIQRVAATTDVREMRGIAVGETTVGIAEIGPRLEGALAPLTGIMAEHLRVTRGIYSALAGGYNRGTSTAFDAEVGALLDNSPSLTY